MNVINAMNVNPHVGSKPTIQHSVCLSTVRHTAAQHASHQSHPIFTASKPHDSPMTAPSATSHSCHVVAELVSATVGLVSATVGLDKQCK